MQILRALQPKVQGRPPLCFNPGLIASGDGYLLFYRVQAHGEPFTSLARVQLDRQFRATAAPVLLQIDRISDQITSFEDPRAFLWRGEIWLMHNQASLVDGIWSTSLVIGRCSGDRIVDLSVPLYGRNENRALDPAALPAFEKNWTPLVIGEDLFLIYEINPMTVLKYDPLRRVWDLHKGPGEKIETGWPGYLSGSTPLIPWGEGQWLAMFHSYKSDGDRRLYTAGFWLLDAESWKVTALSPEPVLQGQRDRLRDLRAGRRRFLRYDPHYLVVFPCGLARDGTDLVVSLGLNDCQVALARFTEEEVNAALKPLAA